MKTSKPASFARALRAVRTAKGLSQEAFDLVSSRTYVSALERGIKMPTINKVVELSAVCGVHPLTLLVLSFCRDGGQAEIQHVLSRIRQELEALEVADL